MLRRKAEIVVAWLGLPFYGARLLRPVLEQFGERISVIATPGPFSRDLIDAELGRPATWIDPTKPCQWRDVGMPLPKFFIQTGWASSVFNSLAFDVKRAGGRVVLMADNCEKGNLRQFAGRAAYRLQYGRLFDAALVPGESARRLLSSFGLKASRIFSGLYGADPEIFTPGPPLAERRKRFLFVGSLIERKSPDLLLKAFREFRRRDATWNLTYIGSGPLSQTLQCEDVDVLPFSDPKTIAREMRSSRVLVLPSIEDHWGVVVHEAALSGCTLIVSDGVGAKDDLITSGNGFVFRRKDLASLVAALSAAASLDEGALRLNYATSIQSASNFGPRTFQQAFTASLRAIGGPV